MSKNFNVYRSLQNKFGRIFLLNMSTRKDRLDTMLAQLKEFGLPDDYRQCDLDIHYATEFPYNGLIANAFNISKLGNFSLPNEFDCARNHYGMIRQAFEQGYDTCLILEDDIRFLNDKETWQRYIDAIPNDFDVLQFGGFSGDPKMKKYMETKSLWTTHHDVGLWNCSMYALSRQGMRFYVSFMDKVCFWVADGPLYKSPLNDKICKSYMSNIPLVIQADKNIVKSDIRSKQTDEIDYNTMNIYESEIDKASYWENNNLK